MARRSKAPDEALGPAVDGLSLVQPAQRDQPAPPMPEAEPEVPEEPVEIVEHPVALLCGQGPVVESVGRLAESCGFIVEHVVREDNSNLSMTEENPWLRLDNFDNFVEDCAIDRHYFVCIFLDDIADCETILRQCLESQASYIGLWADMEKRSAIFAGLKTAGAPDAELAAVRCPIGLNLGASTPDQLAVAVVAEMLATRQGTMQRLLYED